MNFKKSGLAVSCVNTSRLGKSSMLKEHCALSLFMLGFLQVVLTGKTKETEKVRLGKLISLTSATDSPLSTKFSI